MTSPGRPSTPIPTTEASLLMFCEVELVRRRVHLQVYSDIVTVAPKAGIGMSGVLLSHYHFKS